MRRLRGLLAGTLVLLVLPTVTAAAQTDELQQQLSQRSRERAAAEQQLREIRVAEGNVRDRLQSAEAHLAAAQAELAEVEAELALARARSDQAHAALAEAETERDEATEAADDARRALARVERRVARTEARLQEAQQRLELRIRAAFKYGNVSFTEAFTGVRDIADFLNSSTYVGKVMENDRDLVHAVLDLVDQVEAERAEAQALRVEAERQAATAARAASRAAEAATAADAATAEVEAVVADQERATQAVAERHAEHEAALEALRDDRESIEGHLAALEQESGRIEAQLATIARQQAEEAARREAEEQAADDEPDDGGPSDGSSPAPSPPPTVSDPSPGGWVRPVAGRVTSSFGPRWGRNHNGVDLAGSVGTSVAASRDGVVVHVTTGCHPTNSFGCGGGFGNYVMVSHAGGMATIYAHLSSVGVRNGQSVSAGQVVGAVGNSGSSYGAHLHFEVRDGGSPRNPCNYIAC